MKAGGEAIRYSLDKVDVKKNLISQETDLNQLAELT